MTKRAALRFIAFSRSPSGAQSAPAHQTCPAPAGRLGVALALVFIINSVDAADRSRSLRAEFQRLNPCPSTGAVSGPCPGYHVDHREALICGGRDEMGNLQWLDIEEHKAKTRAEVKLCRRR